MSSIHPTRLDGMPAHSLSARRGEAEWGGVAVGVYWGEKMEGVMEGVRRGVRSDRKEREIPVRGSEVESE